MECTEIDGLVDPEEYLRLSIAPLKQLFAKMKDLLACQPYFKPQQSTFDSSRTRNTRPDDGNR